ncbi:hypothetical protein OCU04_004479 [Sclerotinia nivalis]|uniref:Uncharacterized protein n=1 Tax=Sclerotinia nivalis TaxID=352851 RepID=A0A9X0ARB1_9HELO|nr:hypothetical protein OCU04_004479 [Sclerotinia nivalis]
MAKDEEFGLNLGKLIVGTVLGDPAVITSRSRLPVGFEEKMALLKVNRELFAGGNTSAGPASSTTSAYPSEYRNTSNRYEQVYSSTPRATTTPGAPGSSHSYQRTTHINDSHPSFTSPALRSDATTALNRNRAMASSRVAAVAPSRSEHRALEKDIRSERSTRETDGPHNNWGVTPIDHFPKEID